MNRLRAKQEEQHTHTHNVVPCVQLLIFQTKLKKFINIPKVLSRLPSWALYSLHIYTFRFLKHDKTRAELCPKSISLSYTIQGGHFEKHRRPIELACKSILIQPNFPFQLHHPDALGKITHSTISQGLPALWEITPSTISHGPPAITPSSITQRRHGRSRTAPSCTSTPPTRPPIRPCKNQKDRPTTTHYPPDPSPPSRISPSNLLQKITRAAPPSSRPNRF